MRWLLLMRRMRSNIRFIGELYKLQLLTARIIHEYLKKQLAAGRCFSNFSKLPGHL